MVLFNEVALFLLIFRCKYIIYIYNYIKNVEFSIQSAHRFNYKYVAYAICSINVIHIVVLET